LKSVYISLQVMSRYHGRPAHTSTNLSRWLIHLSWTSLYSTIHPRYPYDLSNTSILHTS